MDNINRKIFKLEVNDTDEKGAIKLVLQDLGWEEEKISERLRDIEGNEEEELKKLGFVYQDSKPVTFYRKDGTSEDGFICNYKKIFPVEDRPISSFVISGFSDSMRDLRETINEILVANRIEKNRIKEMYQNFAGLIELLTEAKHQISWKPDYDRSRGLYWDYNICPLAVEPNLDESDNFDNNHFNQMADKTGDELFSEKPATWTCDICGGNDFKGCCYTDLTGYCPKWKE